MSNFKNRIVGTAQLSPLEIKANIRNWRKHPKSQKAALEGVLKEVGWVQDVIINQRTNRLVDGHLRVAVAIDKKEPLVPVKFVDLSEEEEALILATIDPIAAMAETDAVALDSLLRDVKTGDAGLQSLLSSLYENEVQALDDLGSAGFEEETDEELDEKPAFLEEEARVQIGKHSCSLSSVLVNKLGDYLQRQSWAKNTSQTIELAEQLEAWIGGLS